MGILNDLAIHHNTDKSSSAHNFCDFYESHFNTIKDNELSVLEIGVHKGSSILMWHDYFQKSKIYGIDIFNVNWLNSERILTAICDQSKREDLLNVYNGAIFDIIVDDGGHKMDQQQITFSVMFKRLKTNGFYVLEDLHTSNMEEYRDYKDYATSTLYGFDNFSSSHKFSFPYLTDDENIELSKSVNTIEIFRNGGSITSVITKK